MLSQVQTMLDNTVLVYWVGLADAVFDAVDETLSWEWERNVSVKSISDKHIN